MNILQCLCLLSMLIGSLMAAPTCLMDGNCKAKMPFHQVDCMEMLKFKHHKATCFMNDADEFLIVALNEDHIAKRSLSDLETYRSPSGGRAVIHRLKRNANSEDAEVLSANDLNKLLKNKGKELVTESPNNWSNDGTITSTVSNGIDSDTDGDNDSPMGVIIFIAVKSGDENELANRNDGAIDDMNEDELTEALFGLLLMGAILDEIQKHQIESDAE